MSFEIAAVDTTENPYKTYSAFQNGCSQKFIAEVYFDDFIEICEFVKLNEFTKQRVALRARYRMLVDCVFDGGDVELIELRGWIDGVACAMGADPASFEWLHDAFEWVLK